MTNREARMQLEDVERLSRLRSGDLSEEEARALWLEVERRPELALALSRLERLDQLVSQLEVVAPTDVARSAASMPRAARRQPWLVGGLTAAAATLAVVAGLAQREPDAAPAPSLPTTATTLTAGVSSLKAEVAGAQVQLAPFSHVVVEDDSLRLTAGSVLIRGTARVVSPFGSLIGDGTFFASMEPSRALADVTALHSPSPGDLMLEPWKQEAKSWAQTGLVVLVLAGSVEVRAGDLREALTPGQAFGPKREVALPNQQPKPAPEVPVVKAVATVTPDTPRPAELVDLARINGGLMMHQAALAKCLASRPMGDRGQIVALLTIEASRDGARLSEATVSDDAPVDPLVASCVLGVLQRVEYPRPQGADVVQLKYPIEFSRRGEGNYLVTLPAPAGGARLGLELPRADLVDVQVGDSPAFGPADAKVTVVLFTELECPFCARAHETLDRLRSLTPNRSVRFVYKHLPLESHPFAREAALRLIAADEQGRFWEFLQRAREQKARTAQALDKVALDLSLDMARFHESVASPSTARRLQADLDEAKRVGAKAVPTWYVNGQEFVGARPHAELMNAILGALKR